MIVTSEELAQIRAQAEAEYPAECCGVILERGAERVVFRCRNIQNALHARDPIRHPRDARTAYYIDPQDLLAIGRREGEGYRVAVIYHSHIDTGSYFSETDKRNALMGGEPSYPEVLYVVVSVQSGRLIDASAYAWNGEHRDFLPLDLHVDEAGVTR
jgi:proteasome lid subunit RPN8/RPN11